MIRRFMYDPELDRVIEIGTVRNVITPLAAYNRAHDTYREHRNTETGRVLKQFALERADAREFAHRKYGDETRWRDV